MLSGWQDDRHLDALCLQQGSVTFLDSLSAEMGWIMVKERKEREGEHGKTQALPGRDCFLPWKGLRLLRVKSMVPDVPLLDNKGRGCF